MDFALLLMGVYIAENDFDTVKRQCFYSLSSPVALHIPNQVSIMRVNEEER